jgi:outer membrane protein OmpA-like peptidoglycan-associated protein
MRSSLLIAGLVGCVTPQTVLQSFDEIELTLALAHRVYAPLCAPVELAMAEASIDFTRIELYEGDIGRAQEHAREAQIHALAALEFSTPCGSVDRDRDTVPDIVDECPDEPEDLDGVEDDDGCREVDPTGDEDRDGVLNYEDACPDVPEDIDGDNDHDGCPETSLDRDGDGIIDAVDACPTEPEDLDTYKDADGCPDPDNDSDGVPDFRDACPMAAEDADLWADDDGCPDPDNDLDGIPDAFDACPNQPGDRDHDGCPALDTDGDGVSDDIDQCPTEKETHNDYLDGDGCPDTPPQLVVVTNEQVEIKEVINFETGSALILPDSHAVLDDVLRVLSDAPRMRLRIEGHTDSEGGEDANFDLSRNRAEAVRAYLLRKGVAPDRLSALGFGETRPIDTNRTPTGRTNNRRVEFHIVPDDEQGRQ